MDIINPANKKIIKTIETDNNQSIDQKLSILKMGFKKWNKVHLTERVNCISNFATLLEKEIDQLAKDLTTETGKPLQESKNEINASITKLKFFIDESIKTLAPKQVNSDGQTNEILDYDPLGIITNISAWNYPYLVGINIFIPALICGNCVLYKPSEFATMTGENIKRLLYKSGIPEDVFQCVIGDGSVAKYLLEIEIDGYFFTGSYKTGQAIAKAVAHKLVPVGLELGGKDPLYVTDEIEDLSACANSVAEGVFYNNGQSCCSVERVYVHEHVYDDFLKSFISAVKNLKVGDPMSPETNQGAITRPEHLNFLKKQTKDALIKGAKLECGGNIVDEVGYFFEPTILSNVDHSMDLMKEETFGPVIGVQKVSSDEQAIELMNNTSYGLTSSVFTSNETRGKKILKQINSGTGYLNCCDRVSGYLPWSGRAHSGLGSTLSIHGIYAFCNPKGYHIRS